ncbi:MAG: hypothetical protein QNJ46_13160 [Leptolyngbyaceae cyanobacterium MO_188.B28]|nr:hypothetical protein [Leptolyngbyaceae cyanobacterium MO_188.B28]
MAIARTENIQRSAFFFIAKSFLVWMLILEVCFLVIGFPVVTLIVAGASILAIALQPIMPASAVLLVVSFLVGFNLLTVASVSAALTAKGIHPQDVSWLGWLNQEPDPLQTPVYAACPLTCSIER